MLLKRTGYCSLKVILRTTAQTCLMACLPLLQPHRMWRARCLSQRGKIAQQALKAMLISQEFMQDTSVLVYGPRR